MGGVLAMTNLEKIQKALELICEVKKDVEDDNLLQEFIDNSISSLELVKRWIRNQKSNG